MPSDLNRSTPWTLWALVAAFCLSQAAVAAVLIVHGQHRTEREVQDRVIRYIDGAESTLNRTLLSMDLTLAGVVDLLEPAFVSRRVGATSPGDGALPLLDRPRASRILAALNARHLEIQEIVLVDREGAVLAGSSPSAMRLALSLPPGFAAQLAGGVLRELRVSLPQRTEPPTGEPTLLFARGLDLPDGRRVAVVAEVPTALISVLLSGSTMRGHLVATLESEDGRLLASAPPREDLQGRLQPWPEALPALFTTDDGANRLGVDRLEARAAVGRQRALLGRQLVLTVAAPDEDAMAAWHQQRLGILAVAVAFMGMTLGVGLLSRRHLAQRARVQDALDRSQQALDQALGAMADGFVLWGPDDRAVRWNERYVQLYPWLRDGLAAGQTFTELAWVSSRALLPGADDDTRARWVGKRLEMHQRADRTFEQDLGNGRVVHAIERPTPDGGVVGVYRDVTAAERRLAEAKARAEAASEAKSRFLAAMSHEIRTPLNAVLGLNGLLLDSPLTDEQRHRAELIRSSGQLLLTLINDILDVSKIEAGKLALEVVDFDAVLAVREVVSLMQERARDKGLEMVLHLPAEPLPLLRGDPSRLRQVLFNLVGNAVKFTETGGIDVTLAWRHDVQPQAPSKDRVALTLSVADTGIGIPPELLPQIFERFTQADSTTARRYGGSGLGLAISREIVQLMGGEIHARAREGGGSVFTFTLVLDCADTRSPRPEPPSERTLPGLEPEPLPRSLRVLVAEDNAVNQILIQAILDKLGHRSDVVGNGLEVLAQLRQATYDLVLMDVQMPDMDGLAATAEIRRQEAAEGRPRLPVVAMTAHAMAEDRQACLDAGMDDHLSKPVDVEQLAIAIRRVQRRSAQPAPTQG